MSGTPGRLPFRALSRSTKPCGGPSAARQLITVACPHTCMGMLSHFPAEDAHALSVSLSVQVISQTPATRGTITAMYKSGRGQHDTLRSITVTLPLQTVFSCMFAQAQQQSACPPLDLVWTQGGHYTIVGKGGQSQLLLHIIRAAERAFPAWVASSNWLMSKAHLVSVWPACAAWNPPGSCRARQLNRRRTTSCVVSGLSWCAAMSLKVWGILTSGALKWTGSLLPALCTVHDG